MQFLDTPILDTKEKLELYLLQLKTNSAAIDQECKRLRTIVDQEINMIEYLILKLKENPINQ